VIEEVESFGAELNADALCDREGFVNSGREGDLSRTSKDARLGVAKGPPSRGGKGRVAIERLLPDCLLAAAPIANERADLVGTCRKTRICGAESYCIGESALRGDKTGGSPTREKFALEEIAGVAEERQLIDVSGDENIGAIVAGTAVVQLWIARILESDVGVEGVSYASRVGLVLVTEGLGPGVSSVELQIGKAVDKAGLEGVVVCSADGYSTVDRGVTLIGPVVVDIDLSGARDGRVGSVDAWIVEIGASRHGINVVR